MAGSPAGISFLKRMPEPTFSSSCCRVRILTWISGSNLRDPGLHAGFSGCISARVELFHRVHHCTSRQLFKGIVSGTARAGFYGRIVVDPDAQVTEAYQENHNLLLSDTAKADTQPQLEIYADDVKCSHGATIGKLNEEEQFYMRSRGIPESEAKVLQMVSFISSVLEILPEGEDRENLAAYVGQTVRNGF